MEYEKARNTPYDIEIEQAALGCCLVDNSAIDALASILDSQAFYDPLHQRIFAEIVRLSRTSSVTPLTLHAALKSDPGLQEVGGHFYLAGLAQAAPALPTMRDFANIIREHAARRALLHVAEDIANSDKSPLQQIEDVENALARVRSGAGAEDTLRPFSSCVQEAIDLAEAASSRPAKAYLSWGLRTVDEAIGPLFRRDMTVVGAPPSAGKSALIQHVFTACGRAGKPALFVSAEMSGDQLGLRAEAQAIRVPSDRIRRGGLTTQEFEALVLSGQNFVGLPLYVDDRSGPSVAQIRASARTVQRKEGDLALLLIDHLQEVAPSDPRAHRNEQLWQVTKDLKDVARDLNVPVILVSHISRDNDRRENNRPQLSDLYGSRGIEGNADQVVFLYREFYYLCRQKVDPSDDKAYGKWLLAKEAADGWAEIFSEKNRLGKIGTARVRFNEQLTEFSDPELPDTRQAGLDYENLERDLQK